MKISLLFPDRSLNFNKLNDETMHDTGMDQIIGQLTNRESEQTYIRNVLGTLTDDVDNAAYRGDVFDDIYRNPEMRAELIKLFERVNFLRDYGSRKYDHDHDPGIWDLAHRLEEIKDYIDAIEAIHLCLSKADIKSEGLLALKEYVISLYNGNGFSELKEDIKDLRADTGNLKSVTLGVNLNERFEACGIGIISINNKPFTRSGLVGRFIDKVSGKDHINEGTEWDGDYRFDEFTAQDPVSNDVITEIPAFSPLAFMSIKPISDNDNQGRGITNYMDEITDRLLRQTVKHLRDVLNKYTLLTITDITDLIPEFMYYVRWVEYIEKQKKKGGSFSKGRPVDKGIFAEIRGIYNLKLLDSEETLKCGIVTNDLDFSDERCLYVLTGANRGGKTTVTQAVGQAFLLAQGGIYVPGTEFTFTPADNIFTHFPADEDKTMDLGRLGEECKRFKEIYSKATGKSLVLLNETFSTTSFEEGYYIAKDCEKAILEKGIRTIYNTHMHKLAFEIEELNNASRKYKAASLVMRTQKSGERSYKLEIAPPEGLSYANDIAQKYGVTYEMLTGGSSFIISSSALLNQE
ncbi:MAG: DNA mismatch repair protein [Lachnospiraceae bacterium]|nr:DNA mismatch repair protein [Lachnospiraceae bacterium]